MSPRDRWTFGALGALSALTLALALGLLLSVILEGAPALSWAFLTQPPRGGGQEGGILPAIAGTVWVTAVAMALATPIGVGAGVYLVEYAPRSRWITGARVLLRTFAGVPSVLIGIFGLLLFVDGAGMGLSVMAAGCTLAVLSVPWTIMMTDEALRAVPVEVRRAAFAVGATRWQALRRCVLPAAAPALLPGLVLILARAAGETAPLLFTGVSIATSESAVHPFEPFTALPYHLYVLVTQHPDPVNARPVAFATALVLVALTGGLGAIAAGLRGRFAAEAVR